MKDFFERIDSSLTEHDFETKILSRYCSTGRRGGLNRRGFCNFIRDQVKKHGDEVVLGWFDRWGYDADLFCKESRHFMFTIHSTEHIEAQILEVLPGETNFDAFVHGFTLQAQGQAVETLPKSYQLLCAPYE